MRLSDGGILRLPAAALGRGNLAAIDLLAAPGRWALQFEQVLTAGECELLLRGIYAGRGDWIANFDGIQFTLGRAYYTHLEQDREAEYFAQAAASDATVERWAPTLQAHMAALMRVLLRAQVAGRPGWCGAGVHIFPAGGLCALNGGDIHFDVEGLRDDELESGAPALTCVLMLQPPQSGGGLQVWDALYRGEGEEQISAQALSAASAICHYQRGDLVVIDSRRLHQIQPFGGPLDRVSATIHAVRVADSEHWEVWF